MSRRSIESQESRGYMVSYTATGGREVQYKVRAERVSKPKRKPYIAVNKEGDRKELSVRAKRAKRAMKMLGQGWSMTR